MTQTNHIAFTICSNNYLGQANTLKQSFLKFHPNFKFVMVVVDQPSNEIDYQQFEPAEVLFVSDIDVLDVPYLIDKYDIIELNTSIKPSVCKYLIKKYASTETIYYLDPDLFFYHSLQLAESLLENQAAVLTPHIITPIPRDEKAPSENTFLNFGIYNLGFVGFNAKHSETIEILDWWEERTLHSGYNIPRQGYFVDQLWMTQAPLFFNNIAIINSFGYNMAPWNLHERSIVELTEDGVLLNDDNPLVFYHFSKISDDPKAISRVYNRYVLSDFPKLNTLYEAYKNALEICRFSELRKIPIAYKLKQVPGRVKKRSLLHRVLKRSGKKLVQISEKF